MLFEAQFQCVFLAMHFLLPQVVTLYFVSIWYFVYNDVLPLSMFPPVFLYVHMSVSLGLYFLLLDHMSPFHNKHFVMPCYYLNVESLVI